MLKKFVLPILFFTAPFVCIASTLHASCVEVSISTCVGDFANGGDVETGNRLLGNTSTYSLGILQNNKTRIFITTGSESVAGATNTVTPGFVGVQLDGVTQLPVHHLDVWGRIRSTDSAYVATNGTSRFGVGAATASSLVDVQNGSITIRGTSSGLRIAGLPNCDTVDTDAQGNLICGTDTGGTAAVTNSTHSIKISIPGSVFMSTISLTGLAAQTTPGRSTWTVVGMSAYAADGSTVGMTGITVVVSTGGLKALPLTTPFTRVDIPTATAAGYAAYSLYYTAAPVVVNSGSWVGIEITTCAVAGIATRGVELQLDVWEKPYGSTQ